MSGKHFVQSPDTIFFINDLFLFGESLSFGGLSFPENFPGIEFKEIFGLENPLIENT
jgi:hypothetical protein